MTQAAAHLLIHEGPEAITHRRVATASGVPQGSANYYFPTRAELYAAAVARAEDLRGEGAVALAESLPVRHRAADATARLLLEALYAPGLDSEVVSRRLRPMLAASTDPELAPIMAASRPRLIGALGEVLRRSGWEAVAGSADLELLARIADATLLHGAALGDPDPVQDAQSALTRVLELIGREPSG